MMGSNAVEERKKPTENSPMFFVICVPNQGERGEEGGQGEESERESTDGPHRLTGCTNVDIFSPGSDIYS